MIDFFPILVWSAVILLEWCLFVLPSVPLTFDASAWYFGYSLALLVWVAGFAGWAAWTSLCGQTLLRDETLS